MQESIMGKDCKFLVQTNDENLKHLLLSVGKKENLWLESVEYPQNISQYLEEEQVISFIIGSDVEDPIQSAQRLHALEKRAKIIILTQSKNLNSLQESIKFSPFIGVDVECLDVSKKAEIKEKVTKSLQNRLKREKHRQALAESSSQLSLTASFETFDFHQTFSTKLMDVAPIGITIVNRKGKVLGWNKEAANIFNRNEVRILGNKLFQLFGPLEGRRLKSYLLDNLAKSKIAHKKSLILERTSDEGTNQVLSFTAAPFTYREGTGKALIMTIKDVTEREHAKQELQDMNQTLEERVQERTKSLMSYQEQLRHLASQLSKTEEKERQRLAAELHDNLGQMLAVNKMKMEQVGQDPLPEETATAIEEIKEGMDDAIIYTRKLMSDLKPPPSLDKEDVRATIKWVANKMEKHNLNVTVKDDGQPKKASEEIRTTLLQCVRELLFNVVKHADVNEAILEMSRLDNNVQVIVKDEGQGFKPKNVSSTSPEEGGFGLFNIRERIDLLGGDIEIDSKSGKGTKVLLTVPLVEEKITSDPAEKADTNIGTGKGRETIEVMLVDDHQILRGGLKKVIEEEGDITVVSEASNGEEAVEVAEKTSPDVIVMDVDMPRMDGIDATKQIMSTLREVRVIGLSLHDHQKVRDSMRDAGASAYLSKNEAFETLCATIRSEANMET